MFRAARSPWFVGALLCGCTGGTEYPIPRPELGVISPDGALPQGFTRTSAILRLKFPSQAALDDTKQILVVVRATREGGGDCDGLWSTAASGLKEGAGLIDYPPTSASKLIAPAVDGTYVVLAYALPRAFDLLCQTNEWCDSSEIGKGCLPVASGVGICSDAIDGPAVSPLAGGCGVFDLRVGQSNELPIDLAPEPGRTSTGETDEVLDPSVGAGDELADDGPVIPGVEAYAVLPSRLLYGDIERAENDLDPEHADACVPVVDASGARGCATDGAFARPSATPFVFRPGDALEAESPDLPRLGDLPPWNTKAGFSAHMGGTHAKPEPPEPDGGGIDGDDFPDAKPPCNKPIWWTNWENLVLAGGPVFRAPLTEFDADASGQLEPAESTAAQDFLKSVRAHIPFTLPFRGEVALGSGWFYDGGGDHRGLDYSRSEVPDGEDPTFPVVATADGIVRQVMLMNSGGGNVVVIEHPRKNGPSLWSFYAHLRNGKSADVAAATAMTAGSMSDTCAEYAKFIAKYPNHKTWGTEAHKILVAPGDFVRRGQQIAWAGNTGCGGIAGGLNAEGEPGNATTVNTHLHMYYAMTREGVTASDGVGGTVPVAVYFDPYGVYMAALDGEGCYTLGQETSYPRVLAPFEPDFVDVPIDVFALFSSYYEQMGYGPRSLSLRYDGVKPMLSGTMQPRAPGSWRAVVNLYDTQATPYLAETELGGYTPEELQPSTDGGHFVWTGTFRKKLPGEKVAFRRDFTEAAYVTEWGLQLEKGLFLSDYASYTKNGEKRIAAAFTDRFKGRKFFRERDLAATKTLVAQQKALGFRPISIWRNDTTARYSVLFSPGMNAIRGFDKMTPESFAIDRDQAYLDKWWLEDLQVYESGEAPRLLSLWHQKAPFQLGL